MQEVTAMIGNAHLLVPFSGPEKLVKIAYDCLHLAVCEKNGGNGAGRLWISKRNPTEMLINPINDCFLFALQSVVSSNCCMNKGFEDFFLPFEHGKLDVEDRKLCGLTIRTYSADYSEPNPFVLKKSGAVVRKSLDCCNFRAVVIFFVFFFGESGSHMGQGVKKGRVLFLSGKLRDVIKYESWEGDIRGICNA